MLDLIRGLVRPALTLAGFLAVTAGFLMGKVSGDIYVPLVASMVAWWFAQRRPDAPNGGPGGPR